MNRRNSGQFAIPGIEFAIKGMRRVPHDPGPQRVSGISKLFKHRSIQSNCRIRSLKIQRDHLNSERPKAERIEIRRINSSSCRISADHVIFGVGQKTQRMFAAKFFRLGFVQRRNLKIKSMIYRRIIFDI